jgi:hypothetical protein
MHTKTETKKAPKKEKVTEVKAAVVEEVKAPVVAAAAAPAAPAAKAKRELTAYQKFVQEQRKTGKSMAEAAAAWKAQKA